jgi:hypothetical protein
VDGVWGPRSSLALTEFRQASGLQLGGPWDASVEELLFGKTARHAKAPEMRSFVGGWALSLRDCDKGVGGLAPTVITETKAEAFGGICIFHSMQWQDDAWKAEATCSVNNQTWNSKVILSVKGDQLRWSSERGKTDYVRCARSNY